MSGNGDPLINEKKSFILSSDLLIFQLHNVHAY